MLEKIMEIKENGNKAQTYGKVYAKSKTVSH